MVSPRGTARSTARVELAFSRRASFLAGCLALLLAITPWVLFAYGPKIRAKVSLSSFREISALTFSLAQSRFAKELARMQEGH